MTVEICHVEIFANVKSTQKAYQNNTQKNKYVKTVKRYKQKVI